MNLTIRCLSFLLLAALLASGAWAQGGATAVTPITSYTGVVMEPTKEKDAVSPITDQATLSALWTDWGIKDAQPTVDFTTQLVVVSTTASSNVQQNLTLDDKGNLTVEEISAPIGESQPSFRYVISVISNAGITSVNGVPLPVPVPILRSASADMTTFRGQQFLTITDEKTWEGLWGTSVAPVTVDFTKEEALVVEEPVGGSAYSPAITGVTETTQRLTAMVSETKVVMPPTVVPTDTYPCVVDVIPKSDKPVYFNLGAACSIVPIISTITANSLQPADTAVIVIKDVAAWKELYDKRMPAGTALPDVNFGKDMALVVFAGPTVNMGPTISQVIEVNGKLQVEYYLSPLAEAVYEDLDLVTSTVDTTVDTPTAPLSAVIVPRSDLPVTFTGTGTIAPTYPTYWPGGGYPTPYSPYGYPATAG